MARPIIAITRVNGRLHASVGADSRRSLQAAIEILQSIDQSAGDSWPLGASARRAADSIREVLRLGAAPPPPAKASRSRGSTGASGKDLSLPVGDR